LWLFSQQNQSKDDSMKKFRHGWVLMLAIFSFAACSATLKPNFPPRYVVQEGDTLWDIAGKFLDKPWEWKEIWRDNPQIKNPRHLHPGAVLEMKFYDGKPALVMVRRGTYRLSPQARPQPAHSAIPTIPLNDLKPFLNGALVFDHEQFRDFSYIVSVEGEHVLAHPGVEVYVRYLPPAPTLHYGFYRYRQTYRDPITREFLGISADYIGTGDLVEKGNPATLVVKEALNTVEVKDYVMPNTPDEFAFYFDPRAPSKPINGVVIDMFNSVKYSGAQQVVVINRGKQDGLHAGDVLAVFKNPQEVRDLVAHDPVVLPAKRVGEILIFRPFRRVSFGLVMTATEPMAKLFLVQNP
jgi:LysM domain